MKIESKELTMNNDLYKSGAILCVIKMGFVKNKYLGINECKEHCKNIPENILKQFQLGDEIWYYNASGDISSNTTSEALILIRNNNIICSPIIKKITWDATRGLSGISQKDLDMLSKLGD
jgi:hypothetical protein